MRHGSLVSESKQQWARWLKRVRGQSDKTRDSTNSNVNKHAPEAFKLSTYSKYITLYATNICTLFYIAVIFIAHSVISTLVAVQDKAQTKDKVVKSTMTHFKTADNIIHPRYAFISD